MVMYISKKEILDTESSLMWKLNQRTKKKGYYYHYRNKLKKEYKEYKRSLWRWFKDREIPAIAKKSTIQ